MATIETMNVKLGFNMRGFLRGARRSQVALDAIERRVSRLGDSLTRFGKVAGLVALAGGLSQVAAAAAPAAASVLALPAAAAVAGAAFGAVKIATAGMGDAFSAVAEGDAEKLKEALKGMAPSAQAFVREFQRVHKTFENVRRSIQGRFFRGLDTELNLLASKFLPMLRKQLGPVATEINGLAREASAAARSPFFSGVVSRVMVTTANTLGILRNAVRPFMNLIAGLVDIGLPFMDQLAQWAVRNLRLAAAFVKSERGAAKLSQMIRAAGQVLQRLGGITVNIGSALAGIFRAANVDGGNLLRTIERLSGRFAQWVNSMQGQQQIAAVFQLLSQVAGRALIIIGAIGRVLVQLAAWFQRLPAPIQSVAVSMLAWMIVLGPLLGRVASLVAFARQIAPALRIAGKAFAFLGKGILKAIPMIGRMLGFMGRMLLLMGRVGVRALIMGGRVALAWLIAMGPIGIVIAAVVALVALIILKWKTVKKWTLRIFRAVWGFIQSVAARIAGRMRGMAFAVIRAIQFLRRLPGMVAGFFGRMRDAAVNKAQALVSWMAGLPGRILSAVGNLGSLLWDAGRAIIEGLINGIQSAVGWLQSKLSAVTSMIPDWKGPLSADRRLLEPAGQAMVEGLIGGIDSMIPDLQKQLVKVTRTVTRSPLQRAAAQMLKTYHDVFDFALKKDLSPAHRKLAKMFDRAFTREQNRTGIGFESSANVRFQKQFLRNIAGSPPVVRLEVDGADQEMKRLIRKMVRTDGRGDVQVAFGNG